MNNNIQKRVLRLEALVFLACCMIPAFAPAQSLPATDVVLVKLDNEGQVTEVTEIAANGRYNNQPMFSHDGKHVYYVSEQEDGQTDIFRYDIEAGTSERVSNSPESEYSPTPIPGSEDISVVRVELPDNRQRLWRIDPESGKSELLLPNVEPVGYHTWIDENRVALFILGDTFDLHVAEIGDGLSKKIFSNIGRTLRMNPRNGDILFVDKNTEPWSIAEISDSGGDARHVIDLPEGHEDFDTGENGSLWLGYGNTVAKMNIEIGAQSISDSIPIRTAKLISRIDISILNYVVIISTHSLN